MKSDPDLDTFDSRLLDFPARAHLAAVHAAKPRRSRASPATGIVKKPSFLYKSNNSITPDDAGPVSPTGLSSPPLDPIGEPLLKPQALVAAAGRR